MSKIDVNRLITLLTVVALAVLAAAYGYRVEIGLSGFKFESNKVIAVRPK